MRRIGILQAPQEVDRFAAYLQARELEYRTDPHPEGTEFWLHNEDRIEELRTELERFKSGLPPLVPAPDVPRTSRTPSAAPTQNRRPVSPRLRPGKNILQVAPCTLILCVGSVLATLLTDFFQNQQFTDLLAFAPVSRLPVMDPGDTAVSHWMRGEVWRFFTPMFLHMNFLHLFLGIQWTYVFGLAIESIRGTWRMVGLVLVSAALSNLAQYWWSGPAFGGLSGVGHALFGYVWMKHRYQPELGYRLPPVLHWMFWGWFLMCFTGWLGPIANGAHAVGLAIGILYGMVRFL